MRANSSVWASGRPGSVRFVHGERHGGRTLNRVWKGCDSGADLPPICVPRTRPHSNQRLDVGVAQTHQEFDRGPSNETETSTQLLFKALLLEFVYGHEIERIYQGSNMIRCGGNDDQLAFGPQNPMDLHGISRCKDIYDQCCGAAAYRQHLPRIANDRACALVAPGGAPR